MILADILRRLEQIAEANYIARPMFVGGIPRDIYLGLEKDKYNDLDITTNTYDIIRLGVTFAEELGTSFLLFEDGHLSVNFDEYTYDFSSNFISNSVIEHLNQELKITDNKFYEIYSRDFTINTLHKLFFSDDIIDPTGKGIDDCNRRIIRTICPPNITLKDNAKRAYRAIEFAARFGFEIDSEIISYIKDNLELFSIEKNPILKEGYVSLLIDKAIEKDSERTIFYLLETGLFYNVPLTGSFKQELIKKRLVLRYLDNIKNTNI